MYHIVSPYDVNEVKMEYAVVGKVSFKNHVSFSDSNISQRAHQWPRVDVKKYLGVSLPGTLFYMCKSGHLNPNPMWVILLRSISMDVRRVASI